MDATNDLYINIGGTNIAGDPGSYFVMVRYYTSVALSEVKAEHFQWFRDMAVAQAKKILSRIRGKYSGAIPAPAGNLVLDYKELADEGRQEESDLLVELKNKVPSVPPMYG